MPEGVRRVRSDAPFKVAAIALTCGVVIGWMDTRPTWDDTGVTFGAILLAAAVLIYLRPRYWWITIPCIVAPIVALNVHRPASLVTEVHEDFRDVDSGQSQAVFEIALSPGEGIPVVEAVPRQLALRRAPSPGAPVVDTIASATVKRLEFDSTLYQTIAPAPITARAAATIRGRSFGATRHVSREAYYSRERRDTTITLKAGDLLEFLQHRAEGTCFVRVGGVAVEANPCPTRDTVHFVARAQPLTRWWVHVRTPSASGWLLLTDSTAHVTRRTH